MPLSTDDRPLGMSVPAWKGCSCGPCRAERRCYLGREEISEDQTSLTGWSE